jgi:hypothetical protein
MTDQQAPADLREAYDRATARVTELEKENRGLKIDTVFKEARVSKASAALYTGDDITVEAVTEWASSHGIPIAEAAAPAVAPAADPAAGKLPEGGRAPAAERIMGEGPVVLPPNEAASSIVSAAGSHEATTGAALPNKMSHGEFTKMLADPSTHDAAMKAYIEGRVERNEGNVQADQMQRKGIIR